MNQPNDTRWVPSRRLQNWLTGLAAAVATGVQAQGMWLFFGDVMHIDNRWQRAASFAFLELALLVCALRARTNRILNGRYGVDDLIVWVIAVAGGVLAASDAHGWAKAARVGAPLVAALLFERAISAERSDVVDKTTRKIHWRISLERVACWLRLADAEERRVDEIDRGRRLARLARLRVRAEHGPRWLRVRRVRRFSRLLARENERLRLGVGRDLVEELQADLALLYHAEESTTPDAVRGASPWEATAGTPDERPRSLTDAAARHNGHTGQIHVARADLPGQIERAESGPAGSVPAVEQAGRRAELPAAPARREVADTSDGAEQTQPSDPEQPTGARTDAQLVETYGDQLRLEHAVKPLTEYRVGVVTGAGRRQAGRIFRTLMDELSGQIEA